MVSGAALMTANDAVLKWLADGYPTGQMLFLRGLFAFIPILYLIHRAGGFRQLRIVNKKAQLLRGGLVVVGTFCFVTGLNYLPLADAISITFAGPLFITALAPLVLNEVVGWRRWTAVCIGFLGVLLIIRPTGEAVQWAALFPLVASFTGAVRDIITRKIAAAEQTVTILAVTTGIVALGGLSTIGFGWTWPPAGDLALFVISGFFLGAGHFLMIETFRHAEAVLVAPFKYSSIIWATTLGFVVWGDLPDLYTVSGSLVVVLSGLYILHREMAVRREKATLAKS